MPAALPARSTSPAGPSLPALFLALSGGLGSMQPAAAQVPPVNAASAVPASEAPVAILKRVSGPVELQRGAHVFTPVVGDRLQRADVLRTGPKGSAGLSFVDGTVVAVDAQSTVELRRYAFQPDRNLYDFDLYLQRGAAIYGSGKLAKMAPQAVQVSTPRATIGVRGTRFHVSAAE
ncbi:MAG: hypothetical protein RL722_586 [Pseudomonadota bacterium]|jgi:hypothetical protein